MQEYTIMETETGLYKLLERPKVDECCVPYPWKPKPWRFRTEEQADRARRVHVEAEHRGCEVVEIVNLGSDAPDFVLGPDRQEIDFGKKLRVRLPNGEPLDLVVDRVTHRMGEEITPFARAHDRVTLECFVVPRG